MSPNPAESLRRALDAPAFETETGSGWVRARFPFDASRYPVILDVLANTDTPPRRVVYLLPGGALNFAANYFTPGTRNLAHHLRRKGNLVIGVTPREDSLAPLGNDPAAAGWGLLAHRDDLAAVTGHIGRILGLSHDVLGHSAGAALALSYASASPEGLGRAVIVDTTGPFDPEAEAALRDRAARSKSTVDGLIAAGTWTVDAGNARKTVIAKAMADPDGDSGAARPAGGTFTWAGLLHFGLIRTAESGGVFNWIYEPAVHAGTYTFGSSSTTDTFVLDHTTLDVVAAAANAVGSGMLPTALLRDLFALWAGEPGLVDWSGIDVPVTWVNMARGRGGHPYGARLIREAGNGDVTFTVVPGYGHGDPVWSGTAHRDVWPLLA